MGPRLFLPSARAGLLGASALVLLAGCEGGQIGFSGRDAEWARAQGAFSVVSATAGRAVVSANGNQVAIEPPPGFCLAKDEVETSDRSAFVLIGDCVMEDSVVGLPGGDAAAQLPGMPGIITVSISGDPGFSPRGTSPEDLSQLERYLESAEGRALLGRGGDGSQVSVVETRRQGDILYVLVEDRDAGAVPVLAPRFWRAFVEVNERLAVVTVSGFRDVPMDESQMLSHLGDQVRHLQMANLEPVDEAPVQLAAATPRPRPPEPGSGDEAPESEAEAPADASEGTEIAPRITVLETVRIEEPPVLPEAVNAWAEMNLARAPITGPAGPGASPDEAVEIDPAAEPGSVEGQVPVVLASRGTLDAWAGPETLAATGIVAPVRASDAQAARESGAVGSIGREGVRASPIASAPAAEPNAGADLPEPRPMVLSSAGTGDQGAWPMPEQRPGAPVARQAAPAVTEATPTGIASTPPLPPRRLVDPPADAPGAEVPLPPRRQQP